MICELSPDGLHMSRLSCKALHLPCITALNVIPRVHSAVYLILLLTQKNYLVNDTSTPKGVMQGNMSGWSARAATLRSNLGYECCDE